MPFRAKRTVRDPLGDTWELYVSRSAPPRGLGLAQPRYQKIFSPFEFGCLGLLFAPFLLLLYGISKFVVAPALRLFGSSMKGRAQRRVQIQAICFDPPRRRYWTTTPDQLERVLDEIAEGLRAGKGIPSPEGATYHGER